MKKPTYQYFSLEEYRQRLAALRSRMQDKGVEVMLVTIPENLYYLSGFQTPGYYWWQTMIVSMDRDPTFIARTGEALNVDQLTWVEDNRPYTDNDDWIAKTKDALVDLGLERKRIGIEERSWFITIDDFRRLTAALPGATFVDCYGLVEQGRMIKSTQEIEYIRQAAQAADAGILAGIEAVQSGVTENEVAAEIHRAQIIAGSEYTGLPIFCVSGIRGVTMGHATWYRKRLEPNECIKFEIPACINRYHAALFRPVWLGEPPKEVVRASETAITALQSAKDAIKPGVKVGDIHETIQQVMVSGCGIPKRSGRTGYSIGIAFAPDWGEGHIISFYQGDQSLLQANMTFHLIVHAPLQEYGAFNTSDTILVTDDGCETLTTGVEQKLFVR